MTSEGALKRFLTLNNISHTYGSVLFFRVEYDVLLAAGNGENLKELVLIVERSRQRMLAASKVNL